MPTLITRLLILHLVDHPIRLGIMMLHQLPLPGYRGEILLPTPIIMLVHRMHDVIERLIHLLILNRRLMLLWLPEIGRRLRLLLHFGPWSSLCLSGIRVLIRVIGLEIWFSLFQRWGLSELIDVGRFVQLWWVLTILLVETDSDDWLSLVQLLRAIFHVECLLHGEGLVFHGAEWEILVEEIWENPLGHIVVHLLTSDGMEIFQEVFELV